MSDQDQIQRFIFDNHPVHGMFVRLDNTFQTILKQKSYPSVLQRLLGEAMVTVGFFSGMAKQQGRFTLQFQGDGVIKLISVRCTYDFQLRGIVKWEGDLVSEASLHEALGQGTLVLTYEPEVHGERYQSIVSVQSYSIGESLEIFFQQSEQRAARIILACNDHRAVGLLLQTMPGDEYQKQQSFEHVVQLANTLTSEELLNLDNATILHRLYHQEQVRVFTPQPVRFGCSCTIARMENALLSIGKDEALDILEKHAMIDVTCEFCHRQYQFDSIDVENLFAQGDVSEPPETLH